jgi:SAM-dependent methyltransferase
LRQRSGVHTSPTERDFAEVERSAAEARHTVLKPVEVERYLAPSGDTPFPLEYAHHLLGDVREKFVLDLGCGTGEKLVPIGKRGAQTMGIDISPDLIALAQTRLENEGLPSHVQVGSAYETGMESGSVDVIFCMSLIHHLEIPRVRDEMLRILAPQGVVILKEPIRLSSTYAWLRHMLPEHENVSEYEHPLTEEEFAAMTEPFQIEGLRYFRLPFVPLVRRIVPCMERLAWKTDYRILQGWPGLKRYATIVVARLRRK